MCVVAKARIEQKTNGWAVVPLNEESKPVVAELYGWETFAELEQDESFQQGVSPEETLEAFVARVVRVAKDSKHFSVSVCGKKTAPTLRIWDITPAAREPVEKVSVDLKWSCWSVDESYWEQYAPGTWERMQAAFEGSQGPVQVSTGPRKEIRYGCVTISKGRAEGYFYTEWDEIPSLADTLGLTDEEGNWKIDLDPEEQAELIGKFGRERINDDQEMAFRESIPFSMHSYEPGMDRDFEIRARTFANLMKRIDVEEDQLLHEDKKEWSLIEEIYRKRSGCA